MARVAFVIGDYPSEERSRREKVALSYATAEVEVGIVSAPVTPYFHGMTAAEITMVSPALVQAFREAEAQGYDAAVPLGFLDLGVEGGRSAVDIPILAPFETALHVAALMGDRFGCIAYSEIHFPVLQALVRRYGMEHKIVGWAGSGFDLPDIAANHDTMVENFIAGGAETHCRGRRRCDHPHRHHPMPRPHRSQVADEGARSPGIGRYRRTHPHRRDLRGSRPASQPQTLAEIPLVRCLT